ncbi:MAG: hypothetical protein KJ919_14735, partial [Verrucomicrobia bacterium]|nr:hypothetical protein [Verrucomicrobiota bacterium]
LKRGSIFLLGMAIWFSGAGACFAADDYWTNAVDGDFSVGANWTDGTAPGNTDGANFNKNAGSPYTVTFDVAVTNTTFRVRKDQVAFNLNGLTYRALSNNASIGTSSGDNGWLSLSNGTVIITYAFNLGEASGATGTLVVANGPVIIQTLGEVSGEPNWVHVGYAGYGRLIVTNGSVLAITNKSLFIGNYVASGEGHVVVSGSGSVLRAPGLFVGHGTSSKTSTLEVLDGGFMDIFGTGNFGVYDQVIVDGTNSRLRSASNCTWRGPGAGADVRVRNGGRFEFYNFGFTLGADNQLGRFEVTDGGSAYLSGSGGDGIMLGGYVGGPSGPGGFMTIGTNSTVTCGFAKLLVWSNSTVTLNSGNLQVSAADSDLRGTLSGSGMIGSTSTVRTINSTGRLVPGGSNSAGTLIVTNANLVFTNSAASTTNGMLFLEFSESAHDMVILPGISRSINLNRARVSYSLISGTSFRPLTPGFMDFLIATNITGAVFSDNMTNLLSAVTSPFVQYTYGIVTVGAADYGGLYSGYQALRLTTSLSAGTVVSFH